MYKRLGGVLVAGLFMLATGVAHANTLAVGFLSWDLGSPPNSGAFNITNQTGANSSGDATFPITSTLNFQNLTFNVLFDDASSFSCTMATCVGGAGAYFTSNPVDPHSLDGTPFTLPPNPVQATLAGSFSPTTITLFDGSTWTIGPNLIVDSGGTAGVTLGNGTTALSDGDLAVIYAEASPTTIPEPGSWMLEGTAILGLLLFNRGNAGKWVGRLTRAIRPGSAGVVLLVCVVAASNAFAVTATVKLNVGTTPGSGTAGITFVNATGSGFPAGSITPANITVNLAAACGGAPVATTTATAITTVLGSTRRVTFKLPPTLTHNGTYYVSLVDTADNFSSYTCSAVLVSVPATACAGQGLLGIDPVTNIGYAPINVKDASGNGQIAVVDLNPAHPNPLLGTLSLTGANEVFAAIFNPNNKTVLVETHTYTGVVRVFVIDTVSHTVTGHVDTPLGWFGAFGGIVVDTTKNRAYAAGTQDLVVLDTSVNPPTVVPNSHIGTFGTDSLAFNPATGILVISRDGSNEFLDTNQPVPFPQMGFTQTGFITDGVAFDPGTNLLVQTPEFVNSSFVYDFSKLNTANGSVPFLNVPGLGTIPPVGEGPGGQTVVNCSTHQAVVADEFGINYWLVQLPAAPIPAGQTLDNNGQPYTGTTADSNSAYTIAGSTLPKADVCGTQTPIYMQGDPNSVAVDPAHNLFYALAQSCSPSFGVSFTCTSQFLVQVDLSSPVLGGSPTQAIHWNPTSHVIALPGNPACLSTKF